MLPEPPCSGCVALGHGRVRVYSSKDPMQCGAAALVKQLDVSLGSQQRLDASLLPFTSGRHQGGHAFDVLQVRIGRVLQEEEEDGGMAVERSGLSGTSAASVVFHLRDGRISLALRPEPGDKLLRAVLSGCTFGCTSATSCTTQTPQFPSNMCTLQL